MSAPCPPVEFWNAAEECIACGKGDYEAGFGPRTLVTCDCCLDRGCHIECWHARSGVLLTQERLESSAFQWFCSEGCERVSTRLVELTGVQRPLAAAAGGAAYTVELVRWSHQVGSEQKKVDAAKTLFNSSFAPLIMDNGRNLIDMVCEAFESSDGPVGDGTPGPAKQGSGSNSGATDGEDGEDDEAEFFNFSTFRVLLLRWRGAVVSAATVRAFGPSFCEVPFVATREGYRREGHCRRLMQELEGMLHGMGVQWIVVPAMKGVVKMWVEHFGYTQFSPAEVAAVERRIVMPDPSSAVLVRKQVEGPSVEGKGARGKGKALETAPKLGRRVRFNYAETESSNEDEGERRRGRDRGGTQQRSGRKQGRGGKQQSDEGSDYQMSEEEEEEEAEEDDDGLVAEEEEEEGGTGCDRCGTAASEAWITSRRTGKAGWVLIQACEETLCAECATPGDMPAAAAAGIAGRQPVHGPADGGGGSGGTTCATCGIEGAVKRKSGLLECGACSRWRAGHAGEPRPERLWRRQRQRAKPTAAPAPAAGGDSRPAPRPDALRTGAALAPTTRGAGQPHTVPTGLTPLQLRRTAQGARRAARLLREIDARRSTAARQAMHARASAVVHRVQLEGQVADQMGGQLLALVRSADVQQAHVQHAFEQRALQDRGKVEAAEERARHAEHALHAVLGAAHQQAEARIQQEMAAVRAAAEYEKRWEVAAAVAAERASWEARQRALEAELAATKAALEREQREQQPFTGTGLADGLNYVQPSPQCLRQPLQEKVLHSAGGTGNGAVGPGVNACAQGLSMSSGGAGWGATAEVEDAPIQLSSDAAEADDADGAEAAAVAHALAAAAAAAGPALPYAYMPPLGVPVTLPCGGRGHAPPGAAQASQPPPLQFGSGAGFTAIGGQGMSAEAAVPAVAAGAGTAAAGSGAMPLPAFFGSDGSAGGAGMAGGGTHVPGRRRLTTGRSSGGGRRRHLRSRAATAAPGAEGGGSMPAAAAAGGSAGRQERQPGPLAPACVFGAVQPGVLPEQPQCALGYSSGQGQRAGLAPLGQRANGAVAAEAGPSQDWGRGLFGMFATGGSSGSGDGVGVGDSSQVPAGVTSQSAGRGLAGSKPAGTGSAASPAFSLGSLDLAARGPSFGRGSAVDCGVSSAGGGGRRGQHASSGRGAALRRALDSQESRSQQPSRVGHGAAPAAAAQELAEQGRGAAEQRVVHATSVAATPADAAAAPVPAAGPAADAASQAAAMQLDQLLAAPVAQVDSAQDSGFQPPLPAVAGPGYNSLRAAAGAWQPHNSAAGLGSPELADQDEAMRAAADIAQYLAD